MTEMLTAQLDHTIPRRLRVKLQVMEPVYPRAALRILEGSEIHKDESKRVYLMRLVALPELEGGAKWAHPRHIIQYLLDQGLNVGGVYTENIIMEVNGMQPQCVSVSKVLMGRVGDTTPSSMALIVKASGSATASPWQPQSTYAPRLGYDLFAYDGGMHFRPAAVKTTHTIKTDSIINKAMSAVREKAVAEGMATDSHHEAKLIEAISDLRKESLFQETQAVKAQLEALKKESQANRTEQQVSNTFTVIFERRDTGEDEVINVRLTKLERYQRSAGMKDLIGYLIYEEIIPRNLYIPESEIQDYKAKLQTAEGTQVTTMPVIANVTIEGERNYLPEWKVKKLIMKEVWEDQDTIRIGVRLVQSPEEMKWASSWLTASEEGSSKRQAPEGGGGEVSPPPPPPLRHMHTTPMGTHLCVTGRQTKEEVPVPQDRIRPSLGGGRGEHGCRSLGRFPIVRTDSTDRSPLCNSEVRTQNTEHESIPNKRNFTKKTDLTNSQRTREIINYNPNPHLSLSTPITAHFEPIPAECLIEPLPAEPQITQLVGLTPAVGPTEPIPKLDLTERIPTRGADQTTPAAAHFEPIPAGGISEPMPAVQQASQLEAGRPPEGLVGPIPGEAPIVNAPTRGSNEFTRSANHFEPIPAGGLTGHRPVVQQASHSVLCNPSWDLNEHTPGEALIEHAPTRESNEFALTTSPIEPMQAGGLTGAAPAAPQATHSEVHRPSGDLCESIPEQTPIEHVPARGPRESTLAAAYFEPIPARGIAVPASAVTPTPTVTLRRLPGQRGHSTPTQDDRDECETKYTKPGMNPMRT